MNINLATYEIHELDLGDLVIEFTKQPSNPPPVNDGYRVFTSLEHDVFIRVFPFRSKTIKQRATLLDATLHELPFFPGLRVYRGIQATFKINRNILECDHERTWFHDKILWILHQDIIMQATRA